MPRPRVPARTRRSARPTPPAPARLSPVGASACRGCTSTPTRMPAPTPTAASAGPRAPVSRPAPRSSRSGRRRAATSRPRAPRSWRSTSPSSRTTRATVPARPPILTRGLVTPEFLHREIVDLSAWAWDDFLRANGDPALDRLDDVDPAAIFPHPPGALPDRYTGFDDDIATYPAQVREHPYASFTDIPEIEGGRARPRGDPSPGSRRVDVGPRPGRRALSRGRRRRPGRHGREPGLGRSRLAQRRVGRQRQPRDPPPRRARRSRCRWARWPTSGCRWA